jgi:lysophospholipase L1-like esterase
VRKLWLIWFTVALSAQQPAAEQALLNNAQVLESYQRLIQLMESATAALPELARAGAPLIENARQAWTNLRTNPANAGLNYTFLMNLRAYVALSDAVPRPFPFPEEAQKQLNELRAGLGRAESHFRALIEQKDQQLRSPDGDNLARYREMNSRAGAPQRGKPRVVFLGDSITDRWRLNEYFPDQDFANRGINGQITAQMAARMEADVIRLEPVAVVVLGGTNDIARGVPLTTIEDNLTLMVDLADYHKIKVILASLLPVSDYHQDIDPNFQRTASRPPATLRALNSWIIAFCAKRNLIYLDYYSKVVDASGYFNADLSDDGLHPNSAGYRLMAPVAQGAIESVLGSPASPKPRKRHLFGN